MARILLVLLTFLCTSTVNAYPGTPDEQVSAFFEALESGELEKCIDDLFASNSAMQQKLQMLVVLKQQLGTISAVFGDFIGAEEVSVEAITPSITRIVAVAKFELHPVVWEFWFYKPHEQWMVSQAVFGDQFQFLVQ